MADKVHLDPKEYEEYLEKKTKAETAIREFFKVCEKTERDSEDEMKNIVLDGTDNEIYLDSISALN